MSHHDHRMKYFWEVLKDRLYKLKYYWQLYTKLEIQKTFDDCSISGVADCSSY